MGFFKSNKSSAEIRAKTDKARGQLEALETQVGEQEQALGTALAEGDGGEKILAGLATLKTKVESLRTVIGRMEGDLAAQIFREQKERELQVARALDTRYKKLTADLQSRREKILAAAKDVEQQVAGYDSAAREMQEILAVTGLSQLVGSLIPRGSTYAAGRSVEADSCLRSVTHYVESAIRGALEQAKEAVA